MLFRSVSGLVGGFAGAMYGHSIGGFTPEELLGLVVSIEVIIAAILGGMGTITGAAVGGIAFYLLRIVLRNADVVSNISFLLFGLITLAFLFFLPEGIVPRAAMALRRRRSPADSKPVPDDGDTAGMRTIRAWLDQLREILGGGRR